MSHSETGKLLRFLAIGGGFSLFYAAASTTLINRFDAPPLATSIGLYLICIPAAFWMQKRYAFRAARLRRGALGYYAATQVAAITLVSVLTIRLITHNWWLDLLVFGLIVGLTAVVNFIVGRFFTFQSLE